MIGELFGVFLSNPFRRRPKPQPAWRYGFPDMTPSRVRSLMALYAVPKKGDSSPVVAEEAPPVFFKPGEPTTFEEYDGQEHIIGYLRDAVRGLDATEDAIDPQLLLGPAGMGKTLLAKVVAHELQLRAQRLGRPVPAFLEIFPADVPDVTALDEVLRRASQVAGSVLFVDEIHDFLGPVSRKLYLVLEEGRYQFKGDSAPTKLPPITLIGATTDYGSIHAALKRRWIKHMFEPATPEQLLGYIVRRPFAINRDAAMRIVERTKFSGAPWEGLELYRMAVVAAKGRQSRTIEDVDVERVFTLQKIDEMGLRWMDRRVIQVLFGQPKLRRAGKEQEFVCYGASEQNTCTLAGIDKAEYRESVRPRLMSRGILEVKPYYGQALTERAATLYPHLKGDRA